MSLLCRLGFHKWVKWWDRVEGDIMSGRSCRGCPKQQWSRETYVRQWNKQYGDVPISQKQMKSMEKWGNIR